jgi:hypothetical protein
MNVTRQKVVDLKAVRNARIRAEELEALVASEAELSRLDPVHAVYVGGRLRIRKISSGRKNIFYRIPALVRAREWLPASSKSFI